MPRLNKRQHDKLYSELKQIYPEKCAICGRSDKPLDIDRKNPHKGYNDITNLQFACHPDNCRKDPRGLSVRTLHQMGVEKVVDAPKINSAEFARNNHAEPAFRHWIENELKKRSWVVLDKDFINAAAEHSGCMQQTIQNYLGKVCSFEGRVEIVSRSVAGGESVHYLQFKERIAKELGVPRLPPEILIDEGDLE